MQKPQLTHASLFSGIGGAEVAAQQMDWTNLFHCEINPFGRRVLEYWFPESKSYDDITKTDFREWRGRVSVLTGGFPCQPFSLAGARKGAEDDRYLWPQMLRAIREIQPDWVVGENVAGITTMVEPGPLVGVEGVGDLFETYHYLQEDGQFTIEKICRDFEQEGYSVQPFVIPACACGAPHRRDRVWFVAHRNDAGDSPRGCGCEQERTKGSEERRRKPQPEPDGLCAFHGTADNADLGAEGRNARINEGKSGAQGLQERNEVQQPDKPSEVFGDSANTDNDGLERSIQERGSGIQPQSGQTASESSDDAGDEWATGFPQERWRNFPTQPPVRKRYDGISDDVVRYINDKVYETIKEHYGDESPSDLWQVFQQEEIRREIGRLYKIPEPNLLLQILRCAQEGCRPKQTPLRLSCFSEETSERVLRGLWKHRKPASASQGQEHSEQLARELADPLRSLSHDFALAVKKIVEETARTRAWVTQETIKAYGNAWVPQVAYEIFRAIENEYNA